MVYSLHFVFGHATLLSFKEQLGVATPLTWGWGVGQFFHPDDQTQRTFEMTPGFKPFTVFKCLQEDGDSTKIVCNRTRI